MGVWFGSGWPGNECAVFAYRNQCPWCFLKQRATISWSDSARIVAAYTGRARSTMLGKGHRYALLPVEAKDKPAGQGSLPVENVSSAVYSACGHLLPGIPTVRAQPELLSTYLQVNKMLSLATSFSVRTILVMPQVHVCLFPNTLDCYLCTSRVSGQRYLLSTHAQDWSSKATISVPSWSAWYLGTLKSYFWFLADRPTRTLLG